MQYDKLNPLVLACDTQLLWPVWPGCSFVTCHGGWKGEASCLCILAWTPTEKNKLTGQNGLIFGVRKFSFGRHFSIKSDHQPQFNKGGGMSQTASLQIQRWALTLSAHHYTIWHKHVATLSNTDALSQLPSPTATSADQSPETLSI